MNLLLWADKKLTYLKNNNIKILSNGIPILEKTMIYNDIPQSIVTFQYCRKVRDFKNTAISFFMKDLRLFSRLKKVDKDIILLKNYAAVCGMDLSPSIFMLKKRQLFSIILSRIYDCILGLNGIKIIINARLGDFSTLNTLDCYPKDATIVISNLGCKNSLFKEYNNIMHKRISFKLKPKNILIYGNVKKCDYQDYFNCFNSNIYVFPDYMTNRKYKKKAYVIDGNICNKNKKNDTFYS